MWATKWINFPTEKQSYSSLWSTTRIKSFIGSGKTGNGGGGGRGWYVCTYQQRNVLPEFGNQLWMWIWWNLPSPEITRFKRWHLNMLLLGRGLPKLNHSRLSFFRPSVSNLAFPMELHPISQNMGFGGGLEGHWVQLSF